MFKLLSFFTCINKKSTQNVLFTHAQIRNGRVDSNQILHINSVGDVVIYLT